MQRGPDTQDDAQKQSKSARTHEAFGLLLFGRRMRVSSIVAVGKIHCSLLPVFLGGPYLSDSKSASVDQTSIILWAAAQAACSARRTGVRTMSGLRAIIPGEQGRIRRILRHYTTYWKHIFDGEPTVTANNRVSVYEMRGVIGVASRNGI
jgi:hypothetical protein